jgi:hypothetical protein
VPRVAGRWPPPAAAAIESPPRTPCPHPRSHTSYHVTNGPDTFVASCHARAARHSDRRPILPAAHHREMWSRPRPRAAMTWQIAVVRRCPGRARSSRTSRLTEADVRKVLSRGRTSVSCFTPWSRGSPLPRTLSRPRSSSGGGLEQLTGVSALPRSFGHAPVAAPIERICFVTTWLPGRLRVWCTDQMYGVRAG